MVKFFKRGKNSKKITERVKTGKNGKRHRKLQEIRRKRKNLEENR